MSRVVGRAVKLALSRQHRRLWPALAAQAQEPAVTQVETLREILACNAPSVVGSDYGFGNMRTTADYTSAVPVHDYEQLRPHLEQQQRTGNAVLTTEAPVLFARTSGTTGAPKDIPITPRGLARQAKAQRLLASMVSEHSSIFTGRVLTIGSPTVEGCLPSGTPYGSASGMILDGMPAMIRRSYLVTPEIAAIADHDSRYRVIALEALAEPNVTALATANPSTLVRLRDVMVEQWDDLVAKVHNRDERRGRQLHQIDAASLHFEDLWNDLQVVTTWTSGSCGLALDRLRPWLPASTKVVELGYTASELRGTVPLAPDRPDGVPLLADVYFEFVARDRWESGSAEHQGLDSLDIGEQYYVFVTTIDGLYRYDMNDVVEVVDRFHATPTLAFVQKGRGVTSITGEKLAENQLIAALRSVGGGAIPGGGFFMALADRTSADYHLYIEEPFGSGETGLEQASLASRVDDALRATNIEYETKRASSRLGPLVVHPLSPGAGDRYRRACLDQGQRDAQFKILHLQYRDQCRVLPDTVEAESDG